MEIKRNIRVDLSKYFPEWKGYLLLTRQSWKRYVEKGRISAKMSTEMLEAKQIDDIKKREEKITEISLRRLDLYLEELKYHFVKGELNGEPIEANDLENFDKEILEELTGIIGGDSEGKV